MLVTGFPVGAGVGGVVGLFVGVFVGVPVGVLVGEPVGVVDLTILKEVEVDPLKFPKPVIVMLAYPTLVLFEYVSL